MVTGPINGDEPPRRPQPELHQLLDRLPHQSGVYLLKGHDGQILYVGKAKNLFSRVRSYFGRASGDTRGFVPLLEQIVGDVETIVTRNEKEALLLENNLIKQHTPRFNVMLRDDKSYLVLRLDPRADFPRLEVTRRILDDGARYFGPYHSATACRQTLRLVNRHFQLRTCSDRTLANRKRPCLQHQIGRCPAPCALEVDREAYQQHVQDVTLFLRGHGEELVGELERRMRQSAANLAFEHAARVRDQIAALRAAQLSQQVVDDSPVDQDVFGFYREGDQVDLVVLLVRQGKLVGRHPFSLSGQEFPDDELLSGFISRYYLDAAQSDAIPPRILAPLELEDVEAKRQWLGDLRGSRAAHEAGSLPRSAGVEILVPRRGPRRKLLELAQQNARSNFATRRSRETDMEQALAKLQRRLRLSRPPRHIECYDVSGMQGQLVVASMAVLIDGEPCRSRYRHFTIQSERKDDFAAMYEVLSRRLKRADEAGWALPDLIVVDGGKAQLSMALAALSDVGVVGPDVVALAKERDISAPGGGPPLECRPIARNVEGAPGGGPPLECGPSARSKSAPGPAAEQGATARALADAKDRRPERVFLPRVKDAIVLRPHSAELFLLARVRDEAHRFAITHHKQMRRRRTLRSGLDDIPGIGPKRRRELLRAMGSLRRIRSASVEQLAAVPGMTLRAAEVVVKYLSAPPTRPTRPQVRQAPEPDPDRDPADG